jgi:hypothetical protein
MTTAKTIQILDANNNNISPAVCVESLYFEETSGSNTYRMSLKNRTLIAGNIINYSEKGTSEDFTIPGIIATQTGNNQVTKLDTSLYSIGSAIKKYMDGYAANTYYSRTAADSVFLKTDGSNCIKSYVYIGDSNLYRMQMASGNTSSGISWNGNTDYIYDSSSNGIDIYGKNGIFLNSSYIKFGSDINNVSKIDIYSSVSTVDNYIKISSYTLDTNAEDISIHSGNTININSDNTLNLTSSKIGEISLTYSKIDTSTKISINPGEDGTLNIFSTKIDNPSTKTIDITDPSNFITAKLKKLSDGSLSLIWQKLPILKLDEVKTEINSDFVNIYSRKININGGTNNNTDITNLKITSIDKNDVSSNLYIKGIKNRITSSESSIIPLMYQKEPATNDTSIIKVVSINGQSIFQDKDISLTTATDVSTAAFIKISPITDTVSNDKYFLWGTNNTNITSINKTTEKQTAAVNYSSWAYIKSTGAIYGASFYATSDSRLKTGIKEIEIEEKLPTVKEFIWKDSSTKSYGFIAQEIEKSGHPELIDTDDSGMKRVNYDATLSLKIAELENKNSELEKRIELLEKYCKQITDK